ncbi:prepilin peptidase [Sphingomonas sp. MMS24-J13]|uniref:prepilin peptidase n=1 Tax=Sphingomonas sp. MMS24-J13 TaxID=3238686 RepID=UPI0038508551
MTIAWVAAGIVLGALAGSFGATLALRWARDNSVVHGRSHCDTCGIRVPAHRLVPILSFVAAGGRCGSCGGAIDRRHLAMECACALIGGVALAIRPDAAGLAGALFGWMLAVLALLDLDHFWLPDALVLPLALIGVAGGVAGLDPSLADRLIGAASGLLALGLIAWSYRRLRKRVGLGQGDAKLVGAIGAWLGWRALPWVVLIAALIGLGWCAYAIVRGRRFGPTDRLPLGTLLAMAAWPFWLFDAAASGGG